MEKLISTAVDVDIDVNVVDVDVVDVDALFCRGLTFCITNLSASMYMLYMCLRQRTPSGARDFCKPILGYITGRLERERSEHLTDIS